MKYLSDYMNDKQTELFRKTGSFFAFGNKQFNEQRQEGVVYYSLGAGLLCPEQNATEVIKGLDEIYFEAIRQDVADHGAEAIIRREYFNFETQISGNLSRLLEYLEAYCNLFPELFTKQIIKNVADKCWDDAVENDWF